jgi:hypothetical protein
MGVRRAVEEGSVEQGNRAYGRRHHADGDRQRQAIWKLLLANTCATVGIILDFAAH